MLYLRQSTASQSALIGPFIDETDGITALTGLTIANTDIRLSANGGNIAAKNSGGGTHDELGMYAITLDATDTATVGRLQLIVHATGAMPVYHEYWVLEEATYDITYAASATGAVPVASIANDAITAASIANNAIDSTAIADGAITAAKIATDAIDADAIADGAITSGVFASGAITADAIAANAIGASELAADAVTEIQSGLATSAALTTVEGKIDTIDSNVDAILVDTGTDIPASIADLPTNAELATALGTADDAVLAAVAALNNLSSSQAATSVLTTQMTQSYAANGTAPTLAQAIFAMHQRLMHFGIVGTVLTVKQLNGSDNAFVITLDSSTAPTSSARS